MIAVLISHYPLQLIVHSLDLSEGGLKNLLWILALILNIQPLFHLLLELFTELDSVLSMLVARVFLESILAQLSLFSKFCVMNLQLTLDIEGSANIIDRDILELG